MNPQKQFCPNIDCRARGEVGKGNIVIHSQKERRYKCKVCGKTFSETTGTALYGLKKGTELFVTVEVVHRLSESGLDDAGERPEDQITPEAEWVDGG